MNQNKLKSNVTKKKFLFLNNQGVSEQAIITIDSIYYKEKAYSIKYLGFIIDVELKFDKHLECVTEEIDKKLDSSKEKKNLDLKTRDLYTTGL